MAVRVECIGLSLELTGDLRQLASETDWQFVTRPGCDHLPRPTAGSWQRLVIVLAHLPEENEAERAQLLALPRQLWHASQLAPVILLGSGDLAELAWRNGVADYVTLPTTAQEVLLRLERVERRAMELLAIWGKFQPACGPLDRLTPRERHVLERLSDGWWVKKIAAELGTSPHTVRNQRAAVLEKLEVESEAEMFGILHAARWFHALRKFMSPPDLV